MELYEKILDIDNIRHAYFELAEKLEEKNKARSYRGLDGVYLRDTEAVSEDIFPKIQEQIKTLAPPSPVLDIAIPKKHRQEMRKIFMYSLEDRIKAQAIYRVIEPIFEDAYSDFLYSYRSTRPSYYAARSATRRYIRKYTTDYVLVGDFRNYTDTIDHEILVNDLQKLGFSSELINILKTYLSVPSFSKEDNPEEYGLKQGVPLIALFANLYLNDMDKDIGPKAQFYRRVGDDFIVFDPSEEKLMEIKKKIELESQKKKLKVTMKVQKATEPFHFLGYSFWNQKISIKQTSLKKIQQRWKRQLKYTNANTHEKMRYLRIICYAKGKNCFHYDFVQLVKQYQFVSDRKQIKDLSHFFFRLVTRYFFNTYTPKLHRETQKLVKDVKIPSLYAYFSKIHSGEKSFSDFVL